LVTTGFLLLAFFVPGPTAQATHYTATDGKWAWCAVGLDLSAGPGGTGHVRMSCQATGALRTPSSWASTVRYEWSTSTPTANTQGAGCSTLDVSDHTNFRYRCSGTHTINAAFVSGPSAVTVIVVGHDGTAMCGPGSPWGNGQTLDGTCASSVEANGYKKVAIDSLDEDSTYSSTFPDYPPIGGTPDIPVPDCSVEKSNAGGKWIATFDAEVTNPDAGATDTYAWDFGDSTSSTQEDPKHEYSDAQDGSDPWVATITVTRAGAISTGECVLEVDFLADDDEGGTTVECAANPAYYDIVGWLKRLFIPCGDALSETYDDLSASASGNWPIGPALDAYNGITAVDEATSDTELEGPVSDIAYTNGGNDCSGLLLPLDFDGDGTDNADVDILGACPTPVENDGGAGGIVRTFQTLSQTVTTALAFVAGTFVIIGGAKKAMGGGSE
jgi:hypothetical protein